MSLPTITVAAYNSDGVPGTAFSDDEKIEIVAIWRAVSDAYRMLNVDVTTEDPNAPLSSYGAKLCIGGESNDW